MQSSTTSRPVGMKHKRLRRHKDESSDFDSINYEGNRKTKHRRFTTTPKDASTTN